MTILNYPRIFHSDTNNQSSSFPDTPASANVAISTRHFEAASIIGIARVAPVPYPKRISRSKRGFNPMVLSPMLCPGSTEL